MKGKFYKVLNAIGIVLLLGLVFLLYYGHKTACPNVSVYYKCNNFWD